MKKMLRGIAGSLLSLVTVATFLWGGCVSCDQFFMFPGVHRPCCDESGKCQRPARQAPRVPARHCNVMPLALGGEHGAVPAPAVLPQLMVLLVSIPVVHTLDWRIDGVEPDPSPPDSQSLYSTFLI